ncbi:hypothetical protein EON64_18275, partial [archaeon]
MSYDATLQSMLCYQQLLETYREGLYLAVVGDMHCEADLGNPPSTQQSFPTSSVSSRSLSPTSTPHQPSTSNPRPLPLPAPPHDSVLKPPLAFALPPLPSSPLFFYRLL